MGATSLRAALHDWFGAQVESWRPLRSYTLPGALPSFPPGAVAGELRLADGLWQCGDQTGYPSLDAALEWGRYFITHPSPLRYVERNA